MKRLTLLLTSLLVIGATVSAKEVVKPVDELVYTSSSSSNGANGANGYGSNGYGSNGYGSNGYGSNGYGSNGSNGYGSNGYGSNGYGSNGYGSNGYGSNKHGASGKGKMMDHKNNYLRVNIEAIGTYDLDSNDKDAGVGYGVFYERTMNLTNEFELGLGLGYESHGDMKAEDNDVFEDNNFSSVPVYFLAKSNFMPENNVKPFAKIYLGYSFNGDLELDEATVEIDDGLYLGAGLGVEYNNFTFEVSYTMNAQDATVKVPGYADESIDFDFSKISLGLGYRF